jgi:hypothetical protein
MKVAHSASAALPPTVMAMAWQFEWSLYEHPATVHSTIGGISSAAVMFPPGRRRAGSNGDDAGGR